MNPNKKGIYDTNAKEFVYPILGDTAGEAIGKLIDMKGRKVLLELDFKYVVVDLPEYKSASNLGQPDMDDVWRFQDENNIKEGQLFTIRQIYPRPFPQFDSGPYVFKAGRLLKAATKARSTSVYWTLLCGQ
jgi:hypothetical protein